MSVRMDGHHFTFVVTVDLKGRSTPMRRAALRWLADRAPHTTVSIHYDAKTNSIAVEMFADAKCTTKALNVYTLHVQREVDKFLNGLDESAERSNLDAARSALPLIENLTEATK